MGKYIRKNKYKQRYIKEEKDKRKITIALSFFLILLIIIPLGITFSRYITDEMSNFFSRSRPFYFYSDQLTENNPAFHIENWSGVETYNLNINLNNRENNLLKVDYDLEYKIEYKCSNNIMCTLDKESGRILRKYRFRLF